MQLCTDSGKGVNCDGPREDQDPWPQIRQALRIEDEMRPELSIIAKLVFSLHCMRTSRVELTGAYARRTLLSEQTCQMNGKRG